MKRPWVSETLKRRWSNPDFRERIGKKTSEAQKKLWANPEYRERVSKRIEEVKSRMFTKEELEELYLNQKKSMAEIAKEKGCSIANVQYLLKKYEIPRRSSKEGKLIAFAKPEYRQKKGEISKKNWGDINYRKKVSEAFSKAKRGEKSSFWKGGKTKATMLIRESAKYNSWRQSVYIRDNFTCQKCGQIGGEIYAHHKKPFSKLLDEVEKNLPLFGLYEGALIYTPLWDVDNGVTLCLKCHKKIHRIGGN